MNRNIFLVAVIALAGLSAPVRAADTWTFLDVGWGQNVGDFANLTINSQGFWGVAFRDISANTLKCTHYETPGGGYSWPETVGHGGFGASVAFSPANELAISHVSSGDLIFSSRSGTSWSSTTVERRDINNGDTSLIFDGMGRPCICYYRKGRSPGLCFAVRNAPKWIIEVVDPSAVAVYNQMAIDPTTGQPVIVYSTDFNGDGVVDTLKVARSTGAAWVISTVDSGGAHATLAIDPGTGNLAVAHWNSITGELRYRRSTPTGWTIPEIVDTAPSITGCSLAIANGTSYLAYCKNGTLLATRDPSLPTWTAETIDDSTTGGQRISLKISPPTGYPRVAFQADPRNGYASGVLLGFKHLP